ncbi:hypothetical protein LCGC14_1471480 [marine sediment metagenome]|uniref:Terminase large subunit gp17-like C-terminal domain-containing protein n=1 Tax=marine sediment metagenome TaxID=412755 RepID=A0A0F9JC81_9ZZZZ
MALVRRKTPSIEISPQQLVEIDSPTADAIEREYCERRLINFLQRAWHVVEPKIPLSREGLWYMEAMCEHLEALYRSEILNLLINIPGRMGKSLTSVVFFPSWIWAIAPEFRFIFGSYSAYLSRRDSRQTRRVIQSSWYQRLWGDQFSLLGDQNQIERFDNNQSGYRIATSVGGLGTGEGASIIGVDDPHNIKQAESDTQREDALNWWDETMGDRLNNQRTGGKLIIAHRTHARDLSAHVLEQGGYTHLCLPMEYESDRSCFTKVRPRDAEVETKQEEDTGETLYCHDPREEEGQLMDPSRVGPPELERLQRSLGSYAWPARLQQRPSLREGGMIKLDWFPRYRVPLNHYDEIVQSWDTANKKGAQHAYSVCLTIGRTKGKDHLLHVFREKMNIPETQRTVKNMANTHWGPVSALLIENAASGVGIIQHLQADTTLPIIPANPTLDKETRMDIETPALEAGNLWLPEEAEWLPEFETEMRDFPSSRFMDQADALSQYLAWARQKVPTDWSMY